MRKTKRLSCVATLLLLVLGCAVTEPTALDRSRIASAIEAEPTRPIESLSQEFGIAELAVVKALPSTVAIAWPDSPQSAWEAVQRWEIVRLSVELPSVQMVMLGEVSTIEVISGWDGLQEIDRTVLALDWDDIEAVWLIRKPTAQGEQLGVWLFDAEGVSVVRFEVAEQADRAATEFEAMWQRATGASH